MKQIQKQTLHSPVLLTEVLETLRPKSGERYLDLTGGYGGHATEILKATGNVRGAVLCDRDPEAVKYLKQKFPSGVQVRHASFADATSELVREEETFDLILADLGVSSPHLDKANRGFSVQKDGPLDMRMDQTRGKTAADLINSAEQSELETILRLYGEEPKARAIARMIVEKRPFFSTHQLAEEIKRVYGSYTKHHPAVRSFQAFRIAVNDELSQIADMLPLAVKLLAPGGRLGIITFHSLEDRLVKQFFVEEVSKGYEADLTIVTKRPLRASAEELRFNPRSRSAKLRAVVKK